MEYMSLAIQEAKKAYMCGEVPVGAIIVYDNKIISKAHNQKEKKQCATKHAEILAIEKASKKMKNWRLNDCEMYVTLEPCPMCASAIKQSRIKKVYAGIESNDKQNNEIINKIFLSDYNNKKTEYICTNNNEEIQQLMKNFFSKKRK